MRLAQILHDNLRATQLEEVLSEVDSKIEAMELNKNVLEDTASHKLQEIQRRREELDRLEAELIQRMLQDDLDNKALVAQLLEDSVRGIFAKEEVTEGEVPDREQVEMEKGEEKEKEEGEDLE